MNLEERQRSFRERAVGHYGAGADAAVSRLLGVSNSAKIIEGGLQLGVANLESFSASAEQWVIICVLRFPPEDEILFALQIRSDIDQARTTMAHLKLQGRVEEQAQIAGSERTAAARNNLVALYLAQDGLLYMRNKGFWDSISDLPVISGLSGVRIDSIAFAIWPPEASVRRSLLTREFVGYLAGLVGQEEVQELYIWEDARALSAEMQQMPATIPLQRLVQEVQALDGYYSPEMIARYHAALNFHPDKHFVILAGISGTGKTRLALTYARAVHGIEHPEDEDPLLVVCPVRPEWTDATGLLGYVDVLTGQYVVPRFLEAVLLATAHPRSPVFVVLDEMNLARVEYYLADVLSAMESREVLSLHQGAVPMPGSTGGDVPGRLPLPKNLYITGTINIDETTSTISDKVLDRAMLIDVSAVDLPGYLRQLSHRYEALEPAVRHAGPLLQDLHALLTPHQLQSGYRTAEEVIRYLSFAVSLPGADPQAVLDDLLVQKVLTRLRGGERQRELLIALCDRLRAPDFPRSATLIDRLLADLDEFGSFQVSR